MYKAIIFDFFNVIHRDPFQHWLGQNGLKRDGDMHRSSERLDSGAISNEEFYRQLTKISGQKVESVRVIYDDISHINKEVVLLIERLKRHYKTALLSNSSVEYLSRIIAKHELESLFDVITVSADVGLIKPDPRIFEHTLDELGIAAKEAIFIDDNPRNVEAGASVGIKSLVYTDIGTLESDLAKAGVAT
jgi:putative hydrolase of the HAD superfamily